MSPQVEQSVLSHPVRMWRIVTIAAVVLSAVALLGAALAFNSSSTRTSDIVNAQRVSCEKVGEPLKMAVVGLVQNQIQATARASLRSFFPNVPPVQLHNLIAEQQAQRRAILRQLQAVPSCAERFPTSG